MNEFNSAEKDGVVMRELLKKMKRPALAVPLIACILAVAVFLPLFSAADNEINDENPELTLTVIDGNAETEIDHMPAYTPDAKFWHDGKEAQSSPGAASWTAAPPTGGYTIRTNAYVPWGFSDDVAFAYKKYNVKESGDDFLEISATILERPHATGGGDAHSKAQAGLMIRSDLDVDSAAAFIQVRGDQILAVYRTDKGDGMRVQYNQPIRYPLEMRMSKRGNTVRLSYRSQGSTAWTNFQFGVGMKATGPLYAGIAASACSSTMHVNANFTNLKITGIGTWVEGEEEEDPDPGPIEQVDEDLPMLSDFLLRETFTDGDFFNAPASASNPVWPKGPQNYEIVNMDGNRMWFKNFNNSHHFVGSADWTDYTASVDLMFTEDCDPDPENASNMVRLYARHTDVPMYGNRDYYVAIYEGYKIGIYKRSFEGNDLTIGGRQVASMNLRDMPQFFYMPSVPGDMNSPNAYMVLGDGIMHTLGLRAFDNKITAYWDGYEVLSYTDDGSSEKAAMGYREIGYHIFGAGNVGIGTLTTSVYIDNLIVRKLDDAFGGDFDNKIGGNWDAPVPDVYKNWSFGPTYK